MRGTVPNHAVVYLWKSWDDAATGTVPDQIDGHELWE